MATEYKIVFSKCDVCGADTVYTKKDGSKKCYNCLQKTKRKELKQKRKEMEKDL